MSPEKPLRSCAGYRQGESGCHWCGMGTIFRVYRDIDKMLGLTQKGDSTGGQVSSVTETATIAYTPVSLKQGRADTVTSAKVDFFSSDVIIYLELMK